MSSGDGSPTYKFAYYCSGHGYGHATRVTAISLVLLSKNHSVQIISNAPRSVFDPILNHRSNRGSYRFSVFEPKVIQPKAYDVDRRSTFENLRNFLGDDRSRILDEEKDFLIRSAIQCVLVDAPFLPCAAAREANIPSVIISNFTFDSCYSYLSASSLNSLENEEAEQDEEGDEEDGDVVDHLTEEESQELEDLVKITISDYSKSDLLLRLPGSIPIPGFDRGLELPSTRWVDPIKNSFDQSIHALLDRPAQGDVIDMPLVVRPNSKRVFDPSTKLKLLKALKVSKELERLETKILLVSFGGQIIPRPKLRRPSTNHQTLALKEGKQQEEVGLLPEGWIAIVCGLSVDYLKKDDKVYDRFYFSNQLEDQGFDYVPDLTALADVLLGKLGYGTCSESVATMTPFIHVPRPNFVEEYGLKRLMRGVTNLEMKKRDFESGEWSKYILRADELGSKVKREFMIRKRKENDDQESHRKIKENGCEGRGVEFLKEEEEEEEGKDRMISDDEDRKRMVKKVKNEQDEEHSFGEIKKGSVNGINGYVEFEKVKDRPSIVVVNHLERFLLDKT